MLTNLEVNYKQNKTKQNKNRKLKQKRKVCALSPWYSFPSDHSSESLGKDGEGILPLGVRRSDQDRNLFWEDILLFIR